VKQEVDFKDRVMYILMILILEEEGDGDRYKGECCEA